MKITILTLALTCLGQSYKKVVYGGESYALFTPPKAGPLTSSNYSYAAGCGFLGTKMSYPQPGTFGDLIGTRKCFDYCYNNGYETAHCRYDQSRLFYCACS